MENGADILIKRGSGSVLIVYDPDKFNHYVQSLSVGKSMTSALRKTAAKISACPADHRK